MSRFKIVADRKRRALFAKDELQWIFWRSCVANRDKVWSLPTFPIGQFAIPAAPLQSSVLKGNKSLNVRSNEAFANKFVQHLQGHRTRLRNRCIVTGRPRAVFNQFRVSRILLRDRVIDFPGLKIGSKR